VRVGPASVDAEGKRSPLTIAEVSVGLYISVPFCRTKCSYCNFASGVFLDSAYESYVGRLLDEISGAAAFAVAVGGKLERDADSIYLGGGTPSILSASQLLRILSAVRQQFAMAEDAEITVECAPGTLTDSLIETLVRAGVNRVSLGVQSFVDREASSVGRLHTRLKVIDEIARLRAAGIGNINIDLIAGLPHQTPASWSFSLAETVALEVPHVSVYMLEVDEESRLGRELIAGGTRYHAHFVPDDAETADFYVQACETLASAGIAQYEISNFARASIARTREPDFGNGANQGLIEWESRHNLKYWTRQPYVGFGVDAHSMLLSACWPGDAIRFANADSLDAYLEGAARTVTAVCRRAAIEESFFLGLRLNRGINLDCLREEFSAEAIGEYEKVIELCLSEGLLERLDGNIVLTTRGRLVSNDVFARFLLEDTKGGTRG